METISLKNYAPEGYLLTLLKEQPPRELYHYTSHEGLFGIVNDKEIWATDTDYLNDSKELYLAFDIARDKLNIHKKSVNQEEQKLFNNMLLMMDCFEKQNSIFVCSFSEINDSLSQWRAYCRGGGYTIGFYSKDLKEKAELQEFFLVRCEYDREKQEEIIDDIIIYHHNLFQQERVKGVSSNINSLLSNVINKFISTLIRFSPILKHKSFSEEKEWRLISGNRRNDYISNNTSQMECRVGRSMLIPYVRFNLEKTWAKQQFLKVTIGPMLFPEKAVKAVDKLLILSGYKHPGVMKSSTPYREF